MKTRETTEEMSSHGVEKRVERRKSQRSAPCAREKPRAVRKNVGKRTCKLADQEENHEKGPRWSWARNQMGNVSLDLAVQCSQPPNFDSVWGETSRSKPG